jgi:dihydrofolate synthase / folylpolyglutamate synthase
VTNSYADILAYLYEQLPMFHRIGAAAYKADLNNTHALMHALRQPQRGLRCVHVAGTNGKGSTSHMLASILQEAGLRTGLYTSPHLKDLRERIRVNGRMITQEEVVRFVEDHRAAFEPISPSFFEWTVALAFHHFREHAVDIAVIEVGLGGRLDSTNVVAPDGCVITMIGWDHMDLLGPTLEHIAREKAGIMKRGVPCVVGRAQAGVREVLVQEAERLAVPLHFVRHDTMPPMPCPLVGAHQQDNVRTVLATVQALRAQWSIPEEAVAAGLANVITNTGLRGRWEVLAHDPLVVADVAHNQDGLRAVLHQVRRTPHDQLHLVLGCVRDKDLDRFLSELPSNGQFYFCNAQLPRALPASELRERALAMGLQGNAFSNVALALAEARRQAAVGDMVLVTGSVFVVAEVL